jgi:hypothetical protein
METVELSLRKQMPAMNNAMLPTNRDCSWYFDPLRNPA